MNKPKDRAGAWRAGFRHACRTLVEQGWPHSTILPELLALVIMEMNKIAATYLPQIEKQAHHQKDDGENILDSTLHHYFSYGGRFARDQLLLRSDLALAFKSDDEVGQMAYIICEAASKEADELFGKANQS